MQGEESVWERGTVPMAIVKSIIVLVSRRSTTEKCSKRESKEEKGSESRLSSFHCGG